MKFESQVQTWPWITQQEISSNTVFDAVTKTQRFPFIFSGTPHGASARAADADELFDGWSRARLNFLVTTARITLRLSIMHLSDLAPTQCSELHYSTSRSGSRCVIYMSPSTPTLLQHASCGAYRSRSGEQHILTPLFSQLVSSYKLIQDLACFHFLSQPQENLDWIKILYEFQTLIDLLSVPNSVEGN